MTTWYCGFSISCGLMVAGVLACLSGLARAEQGGQRPNILFFLVDDMGTTDTSVRFLRDSKGEVIEAPLNRRYRTPNMERLAAQGRLFTQARAYSVCTPTRASLMSGREATRLHITTWTDPRSAGDTGEIHKQGISGPKWRIEGLDPALPTLPRLLGQAGYRTIHCGKAHFGPDDGPAGDPKNIGFDVNIAGCGIGGPGSYWGTKNFSAEWRGGGKRWDIPGLEKYHGRDIFLTEALTRELAATLDETVKEGVPFFAYMAHYAVHAPFEADARFSGNYPGLMGKELAFATMVEGMDKSLGDLLDKLDELGVAGDTLVVFYSDNGSDGPLNLPLNGKKGTRFDGGSRVPMIVAWAKPDAANPLQRSFPIAAGSTDDRLVIPPDFLPTLVPLAGGKVPPGAVIDGHDIAANLRGDAGAGRAERFLVHFPHGRHNNELFTTWVDGDWKLIYQYLERRWQLFHVAANIGETKDLAGEKPELALELARRMIARLDEEGAQYPIDDATGGPVKPDLTPLIEAVK
ncbi:sulfatase-like hydrolase/transferase [Luteolibacter marinus]|uniref:sulfatase-like hydrolase/transferase n=1 Tax=Luteolibacter marinus TaxID=2776705 RepID=UPI001D033A8D|nr:sulfatase-like hydrolase/transferase [Luteolibacter marinus]